MFPTRSQSHPHSSNSQDDYEACKMLVLTRTYHPVSQATAEILLKICSLSLPDLSHTEVTQIGHYAWILPITRRPCGLWRRLPQKMFKTKISVYCKTCLENAFSMYVWAKEPGPRAPPASTHIPQVLTLVKKMRKMFFFFFGGAVK